MSERHKVIVKINGRDYTIVGEEPESYIQGIGKHIDELVSEIMKNNSKLSDSMAAVLAAFTLADDLNKERRENHKLEKELDDFKKRWEEVDRHEDVFEKLKEKQKQLIEDKHKLELTIAEQKKTMEVQINEMKTHDNKKAKIEEELKIAQEKIFEVEHKYLQVKKELTELVSRMKE
ncbi:MAG: cell division protein ZapA [Tissierellales bacterium]|jgi:cell division protein ZapA|nr:cell division protein ZapA [Tissierellales bacterium]